MIRIFCLCFFKLINSQNSLSSLSFFILVLLQASKEKLKTTLKKKPKKKTKKKKKKKTEQKIKYKKQRVKSILLIKNFLLNQSNLFLWYFYIY